ncbi:PRC-barrel domain-containing protein [Streptomyces sp. NPDC048565]|uniref:PRC-barrel domain-containing protein n=1 Tax=Streptomyces sp. NPDC048565 TaxID=3155266 RepID=UPI003424EC35
MRDNLWSFPPTSGHTAGADLTGFSVEATDGSIGKVDKQSDKAGSSYLIVDTGVWIFGKDVLLPAGTIKGIDTEQKKIRVDLTKDQIKDSPEFDRHSHANDPGYHAQVSGYYDHYRIL